MPAAVLSSLGRRREVARDTAPARGPVRPGRVALALARAEGRRLLRHPAFVIGVLLTPLWLHSATGDTDPNRLHVEINIALALVPLAWLTLVAANLGALRSRRHRTDDLFTSLLTAPATRTAAHSLSALFTVPVSAVLAAVWALWLPVPFTVTGRHRPAELAVGVLLVVGGGVVGVAVGRWLPRAFVCLPAIGATIVIQGNLTDLDPSPARWLSFLVEPLTSYENLELRPAGQHLVWLAAWIVLMGVVAVARHGGSRTLSTVAVAAAVVAVAAGWSQTRPISAARAAAQADYIARPAAHQTCSAYQDVRYCAYDDLATRVGDWRPVVDGALAAVPAAVRERGLVVQDRTNPVVGNRNCSPVAVLDTLPTPVRDRLTPEAVWPADGRVHPGTDSWPCSNDSVDGLFLGIQAGAWAVGLPPSPWHLDEHCLASGQARAVAALWLGAQSTPGAGEALVLLRGRSGLDADGQLTFTDWADPPAFGVTWSAADVDAALALLDRPSAEVTAALAAGWDQFVDPATPAAALLSASGAAGRAGATPVVAGAPGACS